MEIKMVNVMNKLIYLELEIKRKIRLLPHIILGTIALTMVVGVVAFCSGKMLYSNKMASDKKLLVFSSQDESPLTRLVVSVLSNAPSLTKICNVIDTDYDKAVELVKDENTISSIIIPKNFMNSLMDGTNDSIDIYFSSTHSIYTLIITELSKAAQTSLQAAEAGIYTLHDYYYLNDAKEYEADANQELNAIYLTRAFSRSKFFASHKLTATGSLTIKNYYFASAILLITLLLGCVFILKTKDTDQIIFIKLKQNGIGLFLQMITHIISIFIVLYIIFISANMGLLLLNRFTDLSIKIKPVHIFTNGMVITLCSSAIICFVSNIFTNKYSAILLHFVLVLAMSFISGAFVPSAFLPDSLKNIAQYMPTTYLFKSISNILSGEVVSDNIVNLIYITLIFTILGTLLMTIQYIKAVNSRVKEVL